MSPREQFSRVICQGLRLVAHLKALASQEIEQLLTDKGATDGLGDTLSSLEKLLYELRFPSGCSYRDFVGCHPEPPGPVGGVPGESYHAVGAEIVLQVWARMPGKDAAIDNWPRMRKYLRASTPVFDCSLLVSKIRDELVRTERRADSGNRRDRKDPPEATIVAEKKKEKPHSDGPGAPGVFWYEGREHKGLALKAFLLVEHLWGNKNQTADFTDLAEPVWGDREESISKTMVGSLRREANNFFRKKGVGIPLVVKILGQKAFLAKLPQKNRKTG